MSKVIFNFPIIFYYIIKHIYDPIQLCACIHTICAICHDEEKVTCLNVGIPYEKRIWKLHIRGTQVPVLSSQQCIYEQFILIPCVEFHIHKHSM